MKITPAQHNNFTSEAVAANNDPYSSQFSKTDASAMSKAIKNGSLDFGDLKSGGGSSAFADSPNLKSESEKAKVSSPRSPVGRKDVKPASKPVED